MCVRVCEWILRGQWLPCTERSFDILTLCGCVPLASLRGRAATPPLGAAYPTQPVAREYSFLHSCARVCVCVSVCVCGLVGVLCGQWLLFAKGFDALTHCGCVPLGLLRVRAATRPSTAATSTEPVNSESMFVHMRVCAGMVCVAVAAVF